MVQYFKHLLIFAVLLAPSVLAATTHGPPASCAPGTPGCFTALGKKAKDMAKVVGAKKFIEKLTESVRKRKGKKNVEGSSSSPIYVPEEKNWNDDAWWEEQEALDAQRRKAELEGPPPLQKPMEVSPEELEGVQARARLRKAHSKQAEKPKNPKRRATI